MRILLVNPPIPRAIRMLDFVDETARKSFGRRVMVGPPLALNELAGMIKDEECVILDQKTEADNTENYNFLERYEEVLRDFQPDYVGITCITAQYSSVIKLLNITKRFNKKILTSVGGIHPTLCPDSFLGSCADLVAVGIGKYSFKMIVDTFKKSGWNADFTKIPGIAINNGASFVWTKPICEFG